MKKLCALLLLVCSYVHAQQWQPTPFPQVRSEPVQPGYQYQMQLQLQQQQLLQQQQQQLLQKLQNNNRGASAIYNPYRH